MSETKTATPSPGEQAAVPMEDLVARALAWKTLTPEERQARIAAARGLFGGGSHSLEDFLREKHAEIDREEAEWETRHLEPGSSTGGETSRPGSSS